MKLQKNKKGFTLIELVVVMAIIGILAVALVPRLTGIQSRSRDTARVTSLNQLAAVLDTYFSDNGSFPNAPSNTGSITSGANGCFSSEGGVVNEALEQLLKGQRAPMDPQNSVTAGGCPTPAQFGYASLQKSAINNNGYILYARVEGYNTSNLFVSGGINSTNVPTSGSGTATDVLSAIGTKATLQNQTNEPQSMFYAVTP